MTYKLKKLKKLSHLNETAFLKEAETGSAKNIYSHEKTIILTEDLPVKQLIERLILNRECMLAPIYGGNVLWNVEINGLCVAQFIQNEDSSYDVDGLSRFILDYQNDENKVGLKFFYFSHQGKHKFTELT